MSLALSLLQSLPVRFLFLSPMPSLATVPLAGDAPVAKSQPPPIITCLCHPKSLWESKMDSLSLSIQSPKSAADCSSNLLAKISTVTHVPKIFQFQNPPEQPRKDNSASPTVFFPTQPDPASDNSCSPIALYCQSKLSWLLSRALQQTRANQQPKFSCLLCIPKDGISPHFPGLGSPLPNYLMVNTTVSNVHIRSFFLNFLTPPLSLVCLR